MADLRFITEDPVRRGFEERMRYMNEQEDRDRRITVEDEQQRRDRLLEQAFHEGLNRLYQRPAGAARPPAPAAPSTPVAGTRPVPSPGSAPVAPAPAAPAAPGAAQRNLRAVTAAGPAAGASDPIMQQLLQRPELAAAAIQRHAELQEQARVQREKEDELELRAIDALAAGDLTTYQYLAGKTGLNVPPEIVADARSRAILGQAANLAQNFFSADEAQAGLFISGMMESGGDVMAALQRSGMPRGKPDVKLEDIIIDGQRVKAKIDMLSGIATPITTAEGEMAQAPATGRGTGRVPAQIQLMEYLQTNIRDASGQPISAEQAMALANQAKSNPERAAAQIYAKVYSDMLVGTPQQKHEAAKAATDQFIQYLQSISPTQNLFQGPAGAAPTPAAPPAAAPGAPASTLLPGAAAAPAPPPGLRYNEVTKRVE